jgi:hypothetical protein
MISLWLNLHRSRCIPRVPPKLGEVNHRLESPTPSGAHPLALKISACHDQC